MALRLCMSECGGESIELVCLLLIKLMLGPVLMQQTQVFLQ